MMMLPTKHQAQKGFFKLDKPESVGMSSDSLSIMTKHLHELVDNKKLAGIQTAVMRKGKLIHFDSYGYADIENKKMIDNKSIFRVFSMTKPIVSVALMQLYEQGKFKLDDPIHKYIPEFSNQYYLKDSLELPVKDPIRIIDLLTHTSGISYGRSQNRFLNEQYTRANLMSSTNNKEFVKKLSSLPLLFEPGTDWEYGMSTNVCGYLIEILSGQSLDDYLKENILIPLEMTSTYFKVPEDKLEDFTVGYSWDENDGLFITENPEESRFAKEVTFYNGGGGLVSTTNDYINFCKMLLDDGRFNDKQIIKKSTLDLMFQDHLAEPKKHQERLRLLRGENGFGLGFSIKGDYPDTLENVFGWGGAVGTYFRIDTDNQLAYILMIQLSPYRHLQLRSTFQNFVNAAIIE